MRAARGMIALSCIGMLAASLPAAATDEDVRLRRNPFERPVLETVEADVSEGGAKTLENPGLRAVLVAGDRSVVNFGGVIMEIGDTANGYKLLAVSEGTAVFRYNGKKVVFTPYEQE